MKTTQVQDLDYEKDSLIKNKFSFLPFPPEGIDIDAIQPNGSLLPDEDEALVEKKTRKLKKAKKFSRNKDKENFIGKEIKCSVTQAIDPEGHKRLFQISEGKIAKGAFGAVAHAYDKKNNRWLIQKTLKKPYIESVVFEEEDSAEENIDLGTKIVHKDRENKKPDTQPLGDMDIDGEYGILSKLSLAHGQFSGISSDKRWHRDFIFMSLAKGKSLDKLENLSVLQFLEITIEIIKAFENLHKEHSVFHRDIKPENIIWDSSTKKITIVDFGLAAKFADKNKGINNVPAGTRQWLAPEIKKFIEITSIDEVLDKIIKRIRIIQDTNASIEKTKIYLQKSEQMTAEEISHLNQILTTYSSTLKTHQAECEILIRNVTDALTKNSLIKQRKLLKYYLKELLKNEADNELEIKKIEECLKSEISKVSPEIRATIKQLSVEFLNTLTKTSTRLKTTIERIEKCSQDNNKDSQTKNHQDQERIELLNFYLKDLEKKYQDNLSRLTNKDIYSLEDINIKTPSTIEELADAIKTYIPQENSGSEDENLDTDNIQSDEIIRKDIQELHNKIVNYREIIETEKDKEILSKNFDAIIAAITQQKKVLENEATIYAEEEAERTILNTKGRVNYSEKTEVYSICQVIMRLLLETDDINFAKYIADIFFKRYDWSDPNKRPTLKQVYSFFGKQLMSYQHSASHKRRVLGEKNIGIINCNNYINSQNELSIEGINEVIDMLKGINIKQVVLLSLNNLNFKKCIAIKNHFVEAGIKVWQDELLIANDVSVAEVENFVSNFDDKKIKQQINELEHKCHKLQFNSLGKTENLKILKNSGKKAQFEENLKQKRFLLEKAEKENTALIEQIKNENLKLENEKDENNKDQIKKSIRDLKKALPKKKIGNLRWEINDLEQKINTFTVEFNSVQFEIEQLKNEIHELKNTKLYYFPQFFKFTPKKSLPTKNLTNETTHSNKSKDREEVYFAQFAKQRKLRNRIILSLAVLSIILSPASLLITVPIAAIVYFKFIEKVKIIKTTENEIAEVKKKKALWKESITSKMKTAKQNSTISVEEIKKVPIIVSQEKDPNAEITYLADKAKKTRFKLFSKNNQNYINANVTLDKIESSKLKSIKIAKKLGL